MESSDQGNIENEKKSTQEDLVDGFAFSLAAMICGIVLFFLPDYFKYEILTKIIAYILVFAGMFSVGGELNKLNGDKDKTTFGVDDFTLGIVFISGSIFIHGYFSNLIINFVVALIFFFGVFGTLKGTIHFVSGIFRTQTKNAAWIKTLITFLSFITAIVTLYEGLKKAGIIDK